MVVVAPDLVEDMRKGTEEQISFLGILSKVRLCIPTFIPAEPGPPKKEVQFDHTLGHELKADDSHVRVTRGLMTRNIGPRFPDLLDEIGRTLESLLAGAEKGTWRHNSILEQQYSDFLQRLGGRPCLYIGH